MYLIKDKKINHEIRKYFQMNDVNVINPRFAEKRPI